MVAEVADGGTIELNWLTSAQYWASADVVGAGLEYQPSGSVMGQGMVSAHPNTSSGGFGLTQPL